MNTRDFEEIFRRGKSFRGQGVVLKIVQRRPASSPQAARRARQTAELLAGSRFGIIVSKKVSLKAVTRNRIRRLIREVIKEERAKISPGLDAVFIVLPGFGAKNLAETKNILAPLFHNIRVNNTQ